MGLEPRRSSRMLYASTISPALEVSLNGTARRAGHGGDRTGTHPWSSLPDTSPLRRSRASPTSRAVCASSNRLAGQLAASTSRPARTLVAPGRVNIFERWESQAALETFRSSGPDTQQCRAMLSVSVQEYDIAMCGPCSGRRQSELAVVTLHR
jgi:quinol monooxygenase YgiN